MTTSVPIVRPVSEIKLKLAELLERSAFYARITGDTQPMDSALDAARMTLETVFKPAAIKGHLDWAYVNKISSIIERLEAKRSARQTPKGTT